VALFKDYLLKSIELKESAKVDTEGISKAEVQVLRQFPFILDHLKSISQETYDTLKNKIPFSELERFKGQVGADTQIKTGEEGRIPAQFRGLFQIKPYGFSSTQKEPSPYGAKMGQQMFEL
jgi:hypothetical protein